MEGEAGDYVAWEGEGREWKEDSGVEAGEGWRRGGKAGVRGERQFLGGSLPWAR